MNFIKNCLGFDSGIEIAYYKNEISNFNGANSMLFNYSRKTKDLKITNFLSPVRGMLDKTWKLTGDFRIPAGSPGKEVIETFNLFFSKLNSIVSQILQKIISLSSLSPMLAEFSHDFKEKFQIQLEKIKAVSGSGEIMAAKADEIAVNASELKTESDLINKEVRESILLGKESTGQINEICSFVDSLADTIGLLSEGSKSIEDIIEVIDNISDETNLLSLNARIEASSAGHNGKGFTVIAQEISKLAKQSKSASYDIKEQLFFLQDKISETVESVHRVKKNLEAGKNAVERSNMHLAKVSRSFESLLGKFSSISSAVYTQNENIRTISTDLKEMKSLVEYQADQVSSITETSEKINFACSEIILSSGVFHLKNHEKAVEIAKKIAEAEEIKSLERKKMEFYMEKFLKKFPFIELLYVTDLKGIQLTENIYSETVLSSKRKSAFGADWSGKEWFYRIIEEDDVFVSRVYRSFATADFCFTVSLPVTDRNNKKIGVMGVDINFENILKI